MPGWLDTFVFVILPNVFWLLYGWAREWQTLIGALLIVAAVRYSSRATIRGSRTLAEAVIRSARIAASTYQGAIRSATSKPEPSDAEPAAPVPASAPPAAQMVQAESASSAPSGPDGVDIADRAAPERNPQERTGAPNIESRADFVLSLNVLRNAIRAALAAIPPTYSNIGQKGAELYGRVTSISFENLNPTFADPEALELFEKLKTEMQTLHRESNEAVHAHQAWESLARINRLARELQTKLAATGSSMSVNVVKETA